MDIRPFFQPDIASGNRPLPDIETITNFKYPVDGYNIWPIPSDWFWIGRYPVFSQISGIRPDIKSCIWTFLMPSDGLILCFRYSIDNVCVFFQLRFYI